jgi:ABC-type multidrug transport system, ATPase and permease components
MRKLLPYIKNYKKEAIVAPLFKMLEASFELLIPIVMANIIDIGIEYDNTNYIWKMCLLMIILGILGLACSLVAQYFAATGAAGFGTELRRDFYTHINSLSYQELDTIGTATLITRMTSDINHIQAGLNLLLRLLLRSPFLVIGAIIMGFTISSRLTMIFLIAAPLLGLAIFLIVKISIPVYKKVQNTLEKLISLTSDNYEGARVIRAFARREHEIKDFDGVTAELQNHQIKAGKIAGLMHPVTYLMVNLAIVGILWFGSADVNIGTLTKGQLIALVSYMTKILLALLMLAVLIMTVTKGIASAIRVSELLVLEPSVTDIDSTLPAEQNDQPIITFTDVNFYYKGDKEPTLQGINLSIRTGETIGIIGGTGSGKTTLVNLIPRLYEIGKGSIMIAGNDIKSYPLKQLRAKMGIVPQKAVLFAGTIRDNIKWGKEVATDEDIYTALTIAQAGMVVEEQADGLDAKVTAGGKNFSGGQRQRLTIARALVRQPDILILDDSASALDYATDAALRKALKEQTTKMTVLLVSQRAVSVRQADRIVVLDNGEIAGQGTHEQLYETCDVYREICLSQQVREEAVS